MINREIYRNELLNLIHDMNRVDNTPFSSYAKIISLVTMNMRYEKIAFNKNLDEHPFYLSKSIIKDAIKQFSLLMDIHFIEDDHVSMERFKSRNLENKHKELWQEIWTRHNETEFQELTDLKSYRLEINDLVKYIVGQECVDLGCGNGSFSFALNEKGAKHVTGIDFGSKSIRYAKEMAKKKDLTDKVTFMICNVMSTRLDSNRYGFAVSNGVFHHLGSVENIKKACKEVHRILKKKGWFWLYIDGKNSISMDLWDASVEVLKEIDVLNIEIILKTMNIKRNKMVHLIDGLNAEYIHSTWNNTIAMLSSCGFGNFKRLVGGADTDFDYDVVLGDKYGEEKFGEGDLRILCQKI